MREFLKHTGIKAGDEVLVHSSFRLIRSAFPSMSIDEFIDILQEIITPEGSLIMPAFTYCFKKSEGDYNVFDYHNSPSVVGAVSETFRKRPEVIRTSSPTHSFSLWGRITEKISSDNSPESPLGKGSVPDYLACRESSFVLLAGADFHSLSFGHYLESAAPVPWHDISPWDYLKVEKIGASVAGEESLKEIPGCSKSFLSFQEYLSGRKLISPLVNDSLSVLYIPVSILLEEGLKFFRENYMLLLCPPHTCQPCDSRRKWYIEHEQ